jgi:hypothetical protein
LYWFIPALANSSVGSSTGTTGLDGQRVCDLDSKYSTNVLRTRLAGHSVDGDGDGDAIRAVVVDAAEEKGKGKKRRIAAAGKTLASGWEE